ncbi:MAG TPA: hypothetical protein VF119_03280, partial [Candidatus Limnocylindrales bacterium]
MRSRFRPLFTVLGAAALVLAGASSALAAAPSSASIDTEFCIPNGTIETCYEIDGKVQYLDTGAGSSVTLHTTTRTTVSEAGQVVSETMSVTTSRTVIQADGTIVITTVTNTRSAGDDPCRYRLVMRLVD